MKGRRTALLAASLGVVLLALAAALPPRRANASSVNPSVVSTAAILGGLHRLVVRHGRYRGAVRLVPNGELSFYFANTGLSRLVDLAPGVVHNYLNRYLTLTDPVSGRIDDVAATGQPVASDSDDACAATFLTLVARYEHVSGNTGWVRRHLALLKRIAYTDLATAQKSAPVPGLIRACQQGNGPRGAGYLMDNCEDYRGLVDLVAMLQENKDPDAAYYRQVAWGVASGVWGLFDVNRQTWRVSDLPEDARAAHDAWYPDGMAQLFPELQGVPGPTLARQQDGYNAALRVASRLFRSRTREPEDLYSALVYAHYLAHCAHTTRARSLIRQLRPALRRGLRKGFAIGELGYLAAVKRDLQGLRSCGSIPPAPRSTRTRAQR